MQSKIILLIGRSEERNTVEEKKRGGYGMRREGTLPDHVRVGMQAFFLN